MTPVEQLVEAVAAGGESFGRPLIVALDGRSGAGKSTLAAEVARRIGAHVIEGDDFYRGGDGASWDAMSAAQKVAHCIDWRRQRPVLESLRQSQAASWLPFDWETFDGQLAAESNSCNPADVIILEGAYSARPELADLVDLRVLLDTDAELRLARLREREGDDYRGEWEGRWSEAEAHYFGVVMRSGEFDLVLRDG